jgi:hypothetical protein
MAPEIIAAWIGLIAVMLAQIVAMGLTTYSVRKQTAVSVLSANRQAWINTLRDYVAEYIAQASILFAAEAAGLSDKDEHVPRYEKLLILEAKIKLLINPNEVDHRKLVELVEAIKQLAFHATQNDIKKLWPLCSDLTAVAQGVLKREWIRVKKAS